MGRYILISILALLLSLTLAACGSNSKLIPATDADALTADLDQIASDVAEGNCEDASAELADAKSRAEALPPSTDKQLKQRLNSGLSSLGGQISDQCEQTDTETTFTDTTPTETATETTPTETETTPTETLPTETETVPTETTPTETTPTQTEAPPTGPNGGTPPSPGNPGGDSGEAQ